MSQRDDQTKSELIDNLATQVRNRLPAAQASVAESFVRQYFARVAAEDLAEHSPVDLYGAALAHWSLARVRLPGERILRVYNPDYEEHGWQSTHTVVEVVCDDMSFLVDSLRMELNRQALTIHLIIHPVMRVRRDAEGKLVEVLDVHAPPQAEQAESILHFEVDRQTEPEVLRRLRGDLERILDEVRAAVEDWPRMRERLLAIAAELTEHSPPLDRAELSETAGFLSWLANDHFTLLGYREYRLEIEDGQDVLRIVPGSGLGILRAEPAHDVSQSFAALPPALRRLAREPQVLILTKSNARATVHRPGYLDYVGIKQFDETGAVVGERRFLGLYASAAYTKSPLDIPVLSRKVLDVMTRSGLAPRSHSGKALLNILESYPRDELFLISEDELFDIAMGILHLQERQRVRLFVRQDPYLRFLSCLVYTPRERYNTEVRSRMQDILLQAFNAESVDFTVHLSESVLARIYFVVHTRPGVIPPHDLRDIEARLAQTLRSWKDDLHDALVEKWGEEEGNSLFCRYRNAFHAAYREDYLARTAVQDIARIEALAGPDDLAMSLYRPVEAPESLLRFKLCRLGQPVPLSGALPMLEHMGVSVVDERPYEVNPAGHPPVWVHDFGMSPQGAGAAVIEEVRDLFQDAFLRVWRGDMEDDGFNRLVLAARLSWREVVVLRSYCKYLRQVGTTFSQSYMEGALARHPTVARLLLELFHARLDPARQAHAATRAATLAARFQEAVDAVANLDEDRILRAFFALTQATVRTNFYQQGSDGQPKPYLSFKLDPGLIPDLPLPRPQHEIFVYAPRVEGVHLRGGKVARGGIRWSDRKEDFRTEVLGLMKAQMVKNAVIVPVGAKGGFVVKRPPPEGDREALLEEGIVCYRWFISGLLDLTDNLVGAKVVTPPAVVRHDGDDPYLVVAADKGTARFSDIANGIARHYGYWLGDAFASGGSTGYDHKKMGITARGAWESVKRHFRELGVDVQHTDFTVIGIGDMSGDVFGNGMLLSEHIRLLGAFDHRHIFLDPDPDPARSHQERSRLFALSRSSWADYDPALISQGGGVFPRSAKSIRLSPQVRAALDVKATALTPSELIRALLRAPVDLLWNGGIGTYVKAARETHAEVGDRSNDAVRVDASQLRCKVVGEGGNLGFTQLGRIELALAGGRINTDFIDNSGGVDCSDHEVNIKILLNTVVANGDMTEKQRNELLVDMTDEVARLVLDDNYQQTQAVGLSEARAALLLEDHVRFIRALERAGRLNPALEYLPNDEDLAARAAAGKGLTRPEIAVLLAYSKITLYQELLASDLCEDPFLSRQLSCYFPTPLRRRLPAQMMGHRLRREIVATYVTNHMVNRAGATFAHRLWEETGAGMPEIARAFTVTREVFGLDGLWGAVEDLDNRVPARLQTDIMLVASRLVEQASVWFLRNGRLPLDIAATVQRFAPGVQAVAQALPELLAEEDGAALHGDAERMRAAGLPDELALRVAGLDALVAALDIVEVAAQSGHPAEMVAGVHFSLGSRLSLHWLRSEIAAFHATTHWQKLARAALREDLYRQHRILTAGALTATVEQPGVALAGWLAQQRAAVERYSQRCGELKSIPTLDLAMLSVALHAVRNLAQSSSIPEAARPHPAQEPAPLPAARVR